MTTVTLDLPDELACQLDGLDLLELLQLGLMVKQEANGTRFVDNGTPQIGEEDDNDDTPIYDPILGLYIYPPYIPDEPFDRSPPDLVPPSTSPLSRQERLARQLNISQWSEEEIQEIEKAREYVRQWQPRDWSKEAPPDLPKLQRTLSKAAWKEQLLAMPPLDEESLQEIENAREYINQWNRRELF